MAVLNSTLRLTLLDKVSGPARQISGVLGGFTRQTSMLNGTIGRLMAFGGAYLGVTQGMQNTVGAAIDFESAFADVRKVVDATDEQFENMSRTIRKMSTELPLAAKDIAALFAAAGESGVATEDLKAFSEMAARVGIAFDMSAGEAGESLAKLKTQLGLTVAETGDMADSINHLSNNMASKAKDITGFMLRVGALAEMGGFAKEEIAAIGSAMIAAGAQSETAATAMQNVVKAMTRGSFAKKGQQEAAKALGLNLPDIAKQMQKDAPKALKKVLGAIAKAPKDQHIALLSQFFGDEAKAFAPLIGNVELLEKALSSVSDKTKYAGSAYREYIERSNTTANVLQLLKNRFADLGMSIGDSMLPRIKAVALEIGEIFDTLGERVTIFDRIGTAIQGFANGLGGGSTFRQMVDDLKELLFGEVDGSSAADEMGRIFMKFKEWGASVRELTSAIAANPIAKFFADLAPYGFQIMLWSTGILMLAGTIRKLASALMFLSGASAILGILKTVGGLADIVSGGTFPKGNKPPTGGKSTPPVAGWWSGVATWIKALGIAGAPGAMAGALSYTPGETFEDQVAYQRQFREDLQRIFGLNKDETGVSGWDRFWKGDAAEPGFNARQHMGIETKAATGEPIRIDAGSVAEMTRPSGVQSVLVTNPQAPNVTVHAPITITGVADPQAAASAASSQLGNEVKSAVESHYGGPF